MKINLKGNLCPNSNNNPNCSIHIKGNKTCKSCSLYGRIRPPEVGRKISMFKKGKKLSEEHKQKIKEGSNPYVRTEEHRCNASERHRGEKNYFYGKGFEQAGSKNHMYGTNILNIWIKKYGEETANKKWKEYRLKFRKSHISKLNLLHWDTIKNDYTDDLGKYRRLADRYTKSSDLTQLSDYEKRGKCDKNNYNIYHLDHIVPVFYGFIHNIDPKFIGSLENLRFVPWGCNIRKGSNLFLDDNFDPVQRMAYTNLVAKWTGGLPKLISIKNESININTE